MIIASATIKQPSAKRTGKTLLAKAGAMFFSVSGSEFVETIVGAGASSIRFF